MRSTLSVVVLSSLLSSLPLGGGCAARVASAPPPTAAPATYDGYGHELVYVAPGVQVLADYDEPIFYAHDFYWRFQNGRWYRSFSFASGWVEVPPTAAVARIQRPQTYAHYRPPGYHARGRSVRRPDPPKSMYQSPPRRLTPLRPPEGYPNVRR
jgi:hypothetical protein